MTQAPVPLPGSRAATQLALQGWLRDVFGQRGLLLPWLVAMLVLGGTVQWSLGAWLGDWGETEILLAGAYIGDAVLRGVGSTCAKRHAAPRRHLPLE